MFNDNTLNGWIAHSGPIKLRHSAHVHDTNEVMRPARGVLLGVLVGLNMWIWAVVLWMAL